MNKINKIITSGQIYYLNRTDDITLNDYKNKIDRLQEVLDNNELTINEYKRLIDDLEKLNSENQHKEYSINISSNYPEGCDIIGAGSYPETRTNITIAVNPKNGYKFVEWTLGSYSKDSKLIIPKISENLNFVAKLEKLPEILNATVNYYTNATKGEVYQSNNDDGSINLVAIPKNDYNFKYWTDNTGSIVSINNVFKASSGLSYNLTANFEKQLINNQNPENPENPGNPQDTPTSEITDLTGGIGIHHFDENIINSPGYHYYIAYRDTDLVDFKVYYCEVNSSNADTSNLNWKLLDSITEGFSEDLYVALKCESVYPIERWIEFLNSTNKNIMILNPGSLKKGRYTFTKFNNDSYGIRIHFSFREQYKSHNKEYTVLYFVSPSGAGTVKVLNAAIATSQNEYKNEGSYVFKDNTALRFDIIPAEGYSLKQVNLILSYIENGLNKDYFAAQSQFTPNDSYTWFPSTHLSRDERYMFEMEEDTTEKVTIKVKTNNPDLAYISLLDLTANKTYSTKDNDDSQFEVEIYTTHLLKLIWLKTSETGVLLDNWDKFPNNKEGMYITYGDSVYDNVESIYINPIAGETYEFEASFKSAIAVSEKNSSTYEDDKGEYEKYKGILFPLNSGYNVGDEIRLYVSTCKDFKAVGHTRTGNTDFKKLYYTYTVTSDDKDIQLTYKGIKTDQPKDYFYLNTEVYPAGSGSLTYDVSEGDDKGDNKVSCNAKVRFTVTPNSGYVFDHYETSWSANTRYFPENEEFEISKDMLYIAYFRKINL